MPDIDKEPSDVIEQNRQIGRAFLVVNAKSRKGQENFELAIKELKEQHLELIGAEAVTDPRLIKSIVKKLVTENKIDTILVGGGDGTISAVAGEIVGKPICLGLLPMGTANDFARNFKIEPDIKRAISIIKEGYVKPVDLGYANERCFLNVASIGMGVSVARNMDNNVKKWLGPLAYGIAAIKTLKQLQPVQVRLSFEGQPLPEQPTVVQCKALQITIANGRYYGGGLVSAPDAEITDHKLAVTVVKMMSYFELFKIIPGLFDGSYVNHLKVLVYSSVDGVVVETKRPHKVNMDGEIAGSTPLHFRVRPEVLSVYTPKPA